jgi:dynein light chain 1, axonemal
MSKGITLKEALKMWEEKHPGEKVEDQEVIKCMMTQPLISKMDSSLSTLSKLRQLSLSTNVIEKISNLNGLGIFRFILKI